MTVIVEGEMPFVKKEAMIMMCEFMGLKKVKYIDHGNGEDYLLVNSDNEEFTIQVRGNRVDGGFMNVFSGDKTKPASTWMADRLAEGD